MGAALSVVRDPTASPGTMLQLLPSGTAHRRIPCCRGALYMCLLLSSAHRAATQQTCTRTVNTVLLTQGPSSSSSSSSEATSAVALSSDLGAYSGFCAPFSYATLPAPLCGPVRIPAGGVIEFGTCVLPGSFCNQETTLSLRNATTGALLAAPTVVAPGAAANSNSGAYHPHWGPHRAYRFTPDSHTTSRRRSVRLCQWWSVLQLR